MGATVHNNLNIHSNYDVSRHAWERMSGRGLSPDAVRRVINFGRVAYVRGATIYAVGRKEVKRFERDGIDLSGVEGVQVVCSDSGLIMTVYRNRDFRGLRPRRRSAQRHSC
ncbi:MAG: DUF4258 domain-containing protein [Deferrisomatales bacterium]|nr:DUF4258 domain-containing protein [Deferrisomatales bacterium]